MADEYEAWFMSKHGSRPKVEKAELARMIELRQEADVIESRVERQRIWDQKYMAGRNALDAFGRSDV